MEDAGAGRKAFKEEVDQLMLLRFMKIFRTSFLFLSLLVSFCFAEGQNNQDQSKVARKLDEYGYSRSMSSRVDNDCDVDAHLDNFAYYLKQEPGARGYMIFYRGQHKSPKYFAFNPEWQFSQLNFEWGFEKGRVILLDGGYRSEAMMELWIVPDGAEPPKPSPTAFPKGQRGIKSSNLRQQFVAN